MTRRERLERKLEKREEWAEKAHARSEARLGAAHKLADSIPLGQPILVGHHSERHARRDVEKIHNGMAKGIEELKLAQHHEGAAAGLERQLKNSIFSDDENAVEALEAKIAKLELLQEQMKACNKTIRKFAKDGPEVQVERLVLLGYFGEDRARDLLKPDFCGRIGFADFETKNNNANIRRLKGRLEEVKARQARQASAEAAPGGVLVEQCAGGYVRVTFPEKPEREVLEALRSAGFRWGGGSWFGQSDKLPSSIVELAEEGA